LEQNRNRTENRTGTEQIQVEQENTGFYIGHHIFSFPTQNSLPNSKQKHMGNFRNARQ
jgi:hypothetical protein